MTNYREILRLNRIGGNMNYIPLIILDALFLPIIPFLHPVGAAYQIIFRKKRILSTPLCSYTG